MSLGIECMCSSVTCVYDIQVDWNHAVTMQVTGVQLMCTYDYA